MTRVIEAGKIALLCIGGAMLYGIVHDQFTARIYLPYLTELHPKIVDSQDPGLGGIVLCLYTFIRRQAR